MGSDAFLALGEKQEMPSGGGMEWMRNFLAAWFALGFNWQSKILIETCGALKAKLSTQGYNNTAWLRGPGVGFALEAMRMRMMMRMMRVIMISINFAPC